MNTALISTIVNSDSLPSMPVVAFKVLELCRRDDMDINDVVDIIEKDPALTAKMMRVSNSSMFGMSKQVSSLQQAVVVLGLRTVKIMALGFSLVDAMKDVGGSGFDLARYWRRSLSAAAAARQFAGNGSQVRRDEAFVGGLLCDIGMVAAVRHPKRLYAPVLERYKMAGGCLHSIEQEILGVTHAQISAMMLSKWNMPDVLVQAVAAHHGEGFAGLEQRTRGLAGVLWAASEVAELFCGDTQASDLDVVRVRVKSRVQVGDDDLEEILEDLNGQVRESADLFKLEVGDEVSYDQIREAAVSRIAELTFTAEKERAILASREQEARTQLESVRLDASTDALTQISNRRAFDERMANFVKQAEASKSDLGLILIDLDHFKKLNDDHGHQAGDEALRLVGKCLKKICDANRIAARYGGEEFAVLAAGATARELRQLAEDIRKSIARINLKYDNTDLSFTASLGACHVSFEEEQPKPEEIVLRADECLYEAKREGRNRVEIVF